MWTISLLKVEDALRLKAQQLRARDALRRAIAAVGGNPAIEAAIRDAVWAAQVLCVTQVHTSKDAISRAYLEARP